MPGLQAVYAAAANIIDCGAVDRGVAIIAELPIAVTAFGGSRPINPDYPLAVLPPFNPAIITLAVVDTEFDLVPLPQLNGGNIKVAGVIAAGVSIQATMFGRRYLWLDRRLLYSLAMDLVWPKYLPAV
jgi:hypothetical protein